MVTSERLLNILGLFTIEHPEWTVEAVSTALNIRISTTYRYFRSLVGAGFVSSYTAGRYVLGPAFTQYDRQMRLMDPLIRVAAPVMERMTAELPPKTMVLLCRLYRTQVMCVDQRFTERTDFASSYERGRPMDLFRGATSKVILANLPLRVVRSLHSLHSDDMQAAGLGKTWDDIKRSLRKIRAMDAFHTEGELHQGMQGVAVPLFSSDRSIIGSLSTVWPERNQRIVTLAQVTVLLQDAARRIEASLREVANPSGTQNVRPAQKQLTRTARSAGAGLRRDRNAARRHTR